MWRRLFGDKQPKPSELVKTCRKCLKILTEDPVKTEDAKKQEKANEKRQKARDEMTPTLAAMKFTLYGDTETTPDKEKINKLVPKLLDDSEANDPVGILATLVLYIESLDFESKKDVAAIFNYVIRREDQFKAESYVLKNSDLIKFLVEGYKRNDIAVNCGTMLREVLRREQLAREVLKDESLFDQFFEFVQYQNFDVASDAFHTFKMLLTKHKTLTAKFLDDNYDDFFQKYKALINSHNYVTRRQSLKLLGEILLDRSNFKVMMRFINDRQNLMLMMTLLKAKSKAIQFEAFHVFKVFVANPNKQEGVYNVLFNNKEKLITFLGGFLTEKEESDEQFSTEKTILVEHLTKLTIEDKPPPETATPAETTTAAPPTGHTDDMDEKTDTPSAPGAPAADT